MGRSRQRSPHPDVAEYRAAVRTVVASIPPGRVMSYGAIAAYLAEWSGRASPRLVGHVMAIDGDGLPWHRVVRSDGRPARGHEARALRRLQDERAPARGRRTSGPADRIDMTSAAWAPDRPPDQLLRERRERSAVSPDPRLGGYTARREPT